MLERLLILINEVVNLQKVLQELVSSNELFTKPIAQAATQISSLGFAQPSQTNEILANAS